MISISPGAGGGGLVDLSGKVWFTFFIFIKIYENLMGSHINTEIVKWEESTVYRIFGFSTWFSLDPISD